MQARGHLRPDGVEAECALLTSVEGSALHAGNLWMLDEYDYVLVVLVDPHQIVQAVV